MSSWGRPRGDGCTSILVLALLVLALGACLVPPAIVWGLG